MQAAYWRGLLDSATARVPWDYAFRPVVLRPVSLPLFLSLPLFATWMRCFTKAHNRAAVGANRAWAALGKRGHILVGTATAACTHGACKLLHCYCTCLQAFTPLLLVLANLQFAPCGSVEQPRCRRRPLGSNTRFVSCAAVPPHFPAIPQRHTIPS